MTLPQRVAHATIVLVLGTGFLAALYMVFVVHAPPGHGLRPLGGLVDELPHEFWMRRRLYALEAWLCFGFLSVYLAMTWLRPSAREG